MPQNSKIAKEVTRLRGWKGDARIFECDPPISWADYSGASRDAKYVVVSASAAFGSGPETYIFPAEQSESGDFEVTNWLELDGSFRGDLDHAAALRNAGYAVA